MANLSRFLTTGVLNPREYLFLTGPLGAVNATVTQDSDGCSTVALELRGTFSMTVEVQGTIDGTNWTTIPMRPVNVAGAVAYVASIVGAVAGVWVGQCAMYRKVRAIATAFTSGLATATIGANNAPVDPLAQGLFATNHQTATAVVNTAVTLTLAAPGAGLRHYITSIMIEHFTTALLTAAAVPVIVTTTNITGAIAFNCRADAAMGGTLTRDRFPQVPPLLAAAQNTATTLVAPATPSVIFRLSAAFFVAP